MPVVNLASTAMLRDDAIYDVGWSAYGSVSEAKSSASSFVQHLPIPVNMQITILDLDRMVVQANELLLFKQTQTIA